MTAVAALLAAPATALGATEIDTDYSGAVDRIVLTSGVEATDISITFFATPPPDGAFDDPLVRFQSAAGPMDDIGSSCSSSPSGITGLIVDCKVPDGIGDDEVIEHIDADLGGGADVLRGGSAGTRLVASGGNGADTIGGSATFNDDLDGDSGEDTLAGGGGDDSLDGGDDDDSLSGGSEDDGLTGGAGGDDLSGGESDGDRDVISYAGGPAVTVSLDNVANDGVTGASEGDNARSDVEVVVGSSGNDSLTGGSESDELQGRAGADALSGIGGDDVLLGGDGNDSHNGGAGADAASYVDRSGSEPVLANLTTGSGGQVGVSEADSYAGGVENLIGGAGADQLVGNGIENLLDGGGGSDKLNGLGGNDTLDGGAGATTSDELEGSAGVDAVSYAGRTQTVTIRLDGSATSGQAGEGDLLAGIENAFGGAAGDAITGTGSANLLEGRGGPDFIEGGGGADSISGGSGLDFIAGGDGADTLDGDADADILFGETGDDQMFGDNGTTVEQGADTLHGGDGDDTLFGGTVGVGPNVLHGGDGNDTLDSSGGGGSFRDVASYEFASGPVSVDLEAGTATGEGTDALLQVEDARGSSSSDVLLAAAAGSLLEGLAGDDRLGGRAGPDQLIGGGGADSLTGGGSVDEFDAGSGSDQLDSLDGLAESPVCGEGADTTVADPIDVLDVSCEASPPPPDGTVAPVPATGDGAAADCKSLRKKLKKAKSKSKKRKLRRKLRRLGCR